MRPSLKQNKTKQNTQKGRESNKANNSSVIPYPCELLLTTVVRYSTKTKEGKKGLLYHGWGRVLTKCKVVATSHLQEAELNAGTQLVSFLFSLESWPMGQCCLSSGWIGPPN